MSELVFPALHICERVETAADRHQRWWALSAELLSRLKNLHVISIR